MILCLGTTPTVQRSMVFQRLNIDDVNRAVEVTEYASGKSINVARVVHTLGKPFVATGFVGGDRGRFLCADLDRAGVPHAFTEVAAQTRLCTTVIDRAGATATELIEESRPVDDQAWQRLAKQLDALRPRAKVIVCSGSLPPGGPADFYAEQVRCRPPGQQVIVDGRGEAVRQALRHRGFIVKLNCEELAATTGLPATSAADLSEAMKRATPEDGAVIVTLGAAGAVARQAERFWTIRVPQINVVSAIGSGDAFAAGLASGLMDEQSLPDALILAAACGVANALTPLSGYIRVDDLERLRRMITFGEGLDLSPV